MILLTMVWFFKSTSISKTRQFVASYKNELRLHRIICSVFENHIYKIGKISIKWNFYKLYLKNTTNIKIKEITPWQFPILFYSIKEKEKEFYP